MSILELLNKIGDENLKVQFLDQCATQINYNSPNSTKIVFGTDQPIDLRGTQDAGIVVWVPRELLKSITSA